MSARTNVRQRSSASPVALPLPGLTVPAGVAQGKPVPAGTHRYAGRDYYCQRCRLPRANRRHR